MKQFQKIKSFDIENITQILKKKTNPKLYIVK